MAEGIPDELYWRLTPVETGALLDEIIDRRKVETRNANLRAGVVASVIMNTHRTKKSDKVWRPDDFFEDEVSAQRQTRLLGPEHLAAGMGALAAQVNSTVRKRP